MKMLITSLMEKIIFTIDHRKNYTRAISRAIGCTDSGAVVCIGKLKKEGIIALTKKGRTKILTFTKKGLKLKSLLEKIQKL